MTASNKQQTGSNPRPNPNRKDRAAEIANTFEWLITAFILAFVFRAFVMEAFRIPTGSMAGTLMGAHFRLRCPQCGYKYATGFTPRGYGLAEDTVPGGPVPLPPVRCPSCGLLQQHQQLSPIMVPVDNGDRILVLKCLYQFMEPKRWDVIVFRNPCDPNQNYIKRLIGLPGEQIEIIDGDVYIDGRIAHKPPAVQEELWMPIYDNDFQPVRPDVGSFNRTNPWRQPLALKDCLWQIKPEDPTRLHLDSGSDQSFTYEGASANNFRVTYAYNDPRFYENQEICSDLMVRFYAESGRAGGRIGTGLTKYGIEYQGWVEELGDTGSTAGTSRLVLARKNEQGAIPIDTLDVAAPAPGRPVLFRFAIVDHRLVLEFGEHRLTHDLDGTAGSMPGTKDQSPGARVFGAGKWTLSHWALFRDIYYTPTCPPSPRLGRATEGRAFQLRKDEFFVMGDNSPNSDDARFWGQPSPMAASKGQEPPRAGMVPRDYLVGKALFVYWPSGFEFPWPKAFKAFVTDGGRDGGPLRLLSALVNLRWIPNVGQMRFIYGGASEKPQAGSR